MTVAFLPHIYFIFWLAPTFQATIFGKQVVFLPSLVLYGTVVAIVIMVEIALRKLYVLNRS